MPVSICIAGATGWAGRPIAEAVLAAPDLTLVSAVSRSAAGQDLGRVWGGDANGVPVFGTVAEGLKSVDVLIDYTSHAAVRGHTLAAIERGVSVVVIGAAARKAGVGVVAAGNFSLTAALAQAAALLAAKYLPSWEIIDYAAASKPDAPSGTARELAERLAEIKPPTIQIPIAETAGYPEARGATVAGNQIHAVRLPGFTLSIEAVFGLPDERLTIRHDAGSSAVPYVAGTLIAARVVTRRVGLIRGLDTLLLNSQ